jgi:hypothetical protein
LLANGTPLEPRSRPYGISREPGFDERGAALVGGTTRVWDEVSEDLELNLARYPEFGTVIRDNLRGLTVLAPNGPVIIAYLVDDEAETIVYVDVLKG